MKSSLDFVALAPTTIPAGRASTRQPIAKSTVALCDADVLAHPPDDGEEYWFALTTGEVKYCLTPLRRAYTVPERNGSDCDDRVGMWWVFHQTPSGPVTNGADERVCVN